MTRSTDRSETAAIPAARRALYAALVLAFPLSLLLVGEVLARLFYHPPAMELFADRVINGVAYRTLDPSVTDRYFPNLSIQPGTSPDLFLAKKPENGIRIFALGESSTLGYPYMMNGSFPAMLRDRLRARFPERTIEVVNLGVTAVTSHTVLDFGRWCLDEQPDAIVVYAGHNEYYGALGVGSTQFVGPARWMVRTYLALHGSRLFLLLKSTVGKLSAAMAPADAGTRPGTLMELMARETTIPFGSPIYRRGLETFRANLDALIDEARAGGVPVVLSTVVSNVRDLAPLEPVALEDWSQDQQVRAARASATVDSLLVAGSADQAERALEEWPEIDRQHAGLAFARGRLAESRGSFDSARAWYTLARDLDGLRFRAPSELNVIVRELARRPGVTLADAESLMISRSPHGLIGSSYLLEHVHPNLAGYGVIADAVEGPLLTVLPKVASGPASAPSRPVRSTVTRIDSIVAAFRIEILVNSWPFTEQGRTVDDLKAVTWEEILALSYLRKEMTWEVLHVRAAERYEAEGRLVDAAGEYRGLIAATPYNVSPYLRLGMVLLRLGRTVEARESFLASVNVERTATALLKLGEIAYEEGRHGDAVVHLTDAVRTGQLEPHRVPEIRLAIAVATLRSGDRDRARSLAEELVGTYPEFDQGKAFLQFVTGASGGRR